MKRLRNVSILFTSPGPLLFQFRSLFIYWYSVSIALGIFSSLYMSTKLARQRSISPIIISDLFPIAIIAAIVFARGYYVLFQWDYYRDHMHDILAIWKGGIAIHGGLIGGSIAIVLFCYLKNQSFLAVMDTLAPSIAMGQAIGRWGNFFNSEAFGLPTNSLLKLAIPYTNRQVLFTNQHFFHPTFLYESCWDFGLCLLLLSLFHRITQRKIYLNNGIVTYFYLIGYGLGRFWIEGIRNDPLCLIGHAPLCEGGLRMAQFMSLLMIALGCLGLQKVRKQYMVS
uniref:Prolipoprotein diacylglyceryl transferase n=1 Tax=Paulinella longichromatophora TaxID=1708747 RepID=A0A2H4ZQD4_9EUKA|nr:prolipoprotein diacylglyceryl transferase [Paulinella longichromatophora]